MWNEITNQKDLNKFMDLFGGFHDSCIKEFKYISGAYVNENLSMHPINSKNTLKVIFQRQYKNPSTIEVEFVDLIKLRLSPLNSNYTCEILDSTIILDANCVYWCDCGEITRSDVEDYKGTVICSSKIRWRTADKYIGSDEIYTEKAD